MDYLLRTRQGYWNDDYARFLVSQVWKIDKPISMLDCGCGYGFLGLLLLPYLPEGSTYTGIDFAEDLIEKGKALFRHQKTEAAFLCENVFEYSAENQYDFVICQAVLRHLDNPAHGLQKYFKECIVSGAVHMRKPENRIFTHAVNHLNCKPHECILVDNSVQNLKAAQKAGMETILFQRDNDAYSGNIVNNFQELEYFLKIHDS